MSHSIHSSISPWPRLSISTGVLGAVKGFNIHNLYWSFALHIEIFTMKTI